MIYIQKNSSLSIKQPTKGEVNQFHTILCNKAK